MGRRIALGWMVGMLGGVGLAAALGGSADASAGEQATASSARGALTAVATVHLKIAVQGSKLIVHLSGPSNREVRVEYTATYNGQKVASGARTVTLEGGEQTTSFKLSVQVATHARIKVGAKLLTGRQSNRAVERPQMSHIEHMSTSRGAFGPSA